MKQQQIDAKWLPCPKCKKNQYIPFLIETLYVCPSCKYHFIIPEHILLDSITTQRKCLDGVRCRIPDDVLLFEDKLIYKNRLESLNLKTERFSAISIHHLELNDHDICFVYFDFRFIAASLGIQMGAMIKWAFQYAIDHNLPIVFYIRSGGARMQEGPYALYQMIDVVQACEKFKKTSIHPYISILANPSAGGVMASVATQADIIYSEPNALICFTGQKVMRVLSKTQSNSVFAEDYYNAGLIDKIVSRNQIANQLKSILDIMKQRSMYASN